MAVCCMWVCVAGVFAYSMAKRMTVDPDLSNSLKSASPLTIEKAVLWFIPNSVLEYLVSLKATRDEGIKQQKAAKKKEPTPDYDL